MDNDVKVHWEEFLNPQTLRSKLISASLYLVAFEMLKETIVERIRDFYCHGWTREEGILTAPEYGDRVLSRNKSPLYASLSWLHESGVVNAQDLATFERLKECRNQVAHEMIDLIQGKESLNHIILFPDLIELLRKIEVWWIVNVELATDPDYAAEGMEVDESQIVPGPILGLKLMVDIALGSEEEASSYLREFRKQSKVSDSH